MSLVKGERRLSVAEKLETTVEERQAGISCPEHTPTTFCLVVHILVHPLHYRPTGMEKKKKVLADGPSVTPPLIKRRNLPVQLLPDLSPDKALEPDPLIISLRAARKMLLIASHPAILSTCQLPGTSCFITERGERAPGSICFWVDRWETGTLALPDLRPHV